MRAVGLLGMSLLCASVMSAAAEGQQVRLRTDSYPGFGRVSFEFPKSVKYTLLRNGDRLLLHFENGGTVTAAASYPRNVLGLVGGENEAAILIAPGSRVQPRRTAAGLVIDLFNRDFPHLPPPSGVPGAGSDGVLAGVGSATAPIPPPTTPAATPSRPSPPVATKDLVKADDAPAAPAAADAAPASPAPTSTPPIAAASAAAPAAPADAPRPVPAAAVGPVALAASRGTVPPGVAGSAISLPFGPTTGLAAFRRGDSVLLVFDERRPIDLGAFRDDAVFGSATVQVLPTATVVRFRPPPGTDLLLSRTADTWTAIIGVFAPSARPIAPNLTNRQLVLPAAAPGQVVTIADPDSGGLLLVGTQRRPGEAVIVGRRTDAYVLLPTWQGVALEPLADTIFLRPGNDGFLLGAEPDGLALAPASAEENAYAEATALTRRYDFSPLSSDSLARQLQAEVEGVAATPPLGRGRRRREAAQTMVALGLGPEAEAMLRLAAAEDPREADNPDAIGLGAIAALLSGRQDGAKGLDDARLTGSDEIALWRAVRGAMRQEGSPEAAQVFAATAPLLLSYPAGLRDRLLPLAAETMALNKTDGTAKLLAARPDDAGLLLARGIWQERQGDKDAALATYGQVAAGADRLARVRAATRAVELRLASGMIDAGQAADALDKQIYAWRGDGRELAVRLRTAELRAQSGAWRSALALLRETQTLWPDDQDGVHARLAQTFAALLGAGNVDRLAPLDLVAMVEENADLLPDGAPSGDIAARVADRLLALDLPKRAEPLLAKLVQTSTGAARAQFGTRLATLRLRADDAAGALAALSASSADNLPPEIEGAAHPVAGARHRPGRRRGRGREAAGGARNRRGGRGARRHPRAGQELARGDRRAGRLCRQDRVARGAARRRPAAHAAAAGR